MALAAYVMPSLILLGGRQRLWANVAAESMPERRLLSLSLPIRVPITMDIRRESVPSENYLGTLSDAATGTPIGFYAPGLPTTQWYDRNAVYKELLAQAFDYTPPKLGMSRWPVAGENSNTFLFNITEGSGGNQVSTVDARVDVSTAVDSLPAVREVAIVERMDDGQWRVAGYGYSEAGVFKSLDLKVTTSGTLYAIGMDDYGKMFVPGAALAVGERVRPTAFTGWVYEVTEAGALPSAEPEWWAADGENASRLVGTARLQAKRYYRPLAHGPIKVEIPVP